MTKQLIESPRAAAIQRRIIARWGPTVENLRDVPDAATVADVAPAELAVMDLAPSRALALIKVAHDTASGHAELDRPDADRRLLTVLGIGTWTVRCLGLFGRGDPDALPSGDSSATWQIGRMAWPGPATPDEVEEFFAPTSTGAGGNVHPRHLSRPGGQGPAASPSGVAEQTREMRAFRAVTATPGFFLEGARW